MVDREAVVTVADLLIHLRQKLITAIESQNETCLDEVESALYPIRDTIIALRPRNAVHLLHPIDHMISAIGDYFHGEMWKSTIPTIEEIKSAFQGEVSERLE